MLRLASQTNFGINTHVTKKLLVYTKWEYKIGLVIIVSFELNSPRATMMTKVPDVRTLMNAMKELMVVATMQSVIIYQPWCDLRKQS